MPSTIPLHPYTDLYYYPGHSFSPAHYVSTGTSSVLGFYALDTSRGRIDLLVALLEYGKGDVRVKDMRAALYSGAIVRLPSCTYLRHRKPSSKSIDSDYPLRSLTVEVNGDASPVQSRDVTVINLKFRYAGPVPPARSDPIFTTKTTTEEDESGWWRTPEGWGELQGPSDKRDEFRSSIKDRIDEFVAIFEPMD